VSAVEAVDESTVRITTPAADPLMPLRLASPNAGILAPKAYAGDQIDIKGTCTGPFTVTDEAPRQSLTLERNENYWDGEVGVATAEMRFIVDGAARTTQLQTGEAHIARGIPAANLSSVEGDENIEIHALEVPRTTVMLLNNSRPPFDNPLVRKAIQLSIDTEAIVSGVYEGTGSPAVGPFGPTSPWAPEGAEPVAVDQEEARSLFEQAGVDPESLEIELIAYNDRPEFADLAAVIQDQLSQVGITVSIRAGEYASLEPDMLAGNFDAALLSRGYTTDMADPASYLRSDWTCEGGYNIAHYCDPSSDQLIQEALANEDLDAAIQQKAEIAAKLQEEAASVWLVHEGAVWGSQADVQNFEPHPLSYTVLTADLTVG
jgi:peptide/nickel transport system substrate-binding protein